MRAHRYIYILFLIIISFSAVAQTGYPRGPVFFEIRNPDDEFHGIFEKVDDGYLLVTGERAFINIESSIHNKQLHFYTGKLDHVWSKPIENNFEAGQEDWRIVTSKKFIYHLSSPHIPGKSLEQHITQFTRYGDKKTKVVFAEDVPRAYFTDSEYLFEVKLGTDTDIKLNKYKHETLDEETIEFDLPSIGDKEGFYKNKRWSFLGAHDMYMYFYKKIISIDASTQTYEYEVLKYDLKGEFIERMKLRSSLGKYFVSPTNNPHIGQIKPQDTYKKKVTSTNTLNAASFGDIYMNPKNGDIFIYGQFASSNVGSNAKYEGVFMQKYDKEGSLEWKTKQSFPSKMVAKDPFLQKHSTEEYAKRVCNLVVDRVTNAIRYEVVLYTSKKGNNRSYVVKWNADGDFQNVVRGINKPRSYMRNRTYNDDYYTYLRNYEYDDYYEQGLPENTIGEDRFQELANLTPGLNIATYEYMSFPLGEVVVEKLHERKAIVFYFIKRLD